MDIQPSMRERSYLESRSNFMKVASLGFGGLSGLGLIWMFGNLGGFGWWLFLVGVALVSGRVWAFFMWFVFKSVYGIDELKDSDSTAEPGVPSSEQLNVKK